MNSFRFIDLFAGIGGTRIGFSKAGGECVFTSEWNQFAKKTYFTNWHEQENHSFADDIREVEAKRIPDHDVLLAGFPCQPFSLAGVSKKNSIGQKHGFLDETQGTLFFEVARILASKKPQAFFLENVKNLISHNNGQTFSIILKTLSKLDYQVYFKVIDSSPWVPQKRQRVYIVGFKQTNNFNFQNLRIPKSKMNLESILHPQNGTEIVEHGYTSGKLARVEKKYVLGDKTWNYLQSHAKSHASKGNGFGFGLVGPRDVARTLSARYYKDGSEILVKRSLGLNPRRLTPRECARLMGFPDGFKIPVSDTQAYKQFGNSVVVPVVTAIAKQMVKELQ